MNYYTIISLALFLPRTQTVNHVALAPQTVPRPAAHPYISPLTYTIKFHRRTGHEDPEREQMQALLFL